MVAKDNWADWSLVELGSETATVEFAREAGTESLWVYLVEDGGRRRRPVREVTWAFEGVGEEEECWVGVYAAKPTPEEADPSEGLEVRFSGLLIE